MLVYQLLERIFVHRYRLLFPGRHSLFLRQPSLFPPPTLAVSPSTFAVSPPPFAVPPPPLAVSPPFPRQSERLVPGARNENEPAANWPRPQRQHVHRRQRDRSNRRRRRGRGQRGRWRAMGWFRRRFLHSRRLLRRRGGRPWLQRSLNLRYGSVAVVVAFRRRRPGWRRRSGGAGRGGRGRRRGWERGRGDRPDQACRAARGVLGAVRERGGG